jgi:hypothetical protein
MTDLRALIPTRLRELDRSMSWLSEQLGKNRAYIQQFIERGSPRDLDDELKLEIARLLQMKPDQVGVRQLALREKGLALQGLHDNAEPYVPPERGFLAKRSNIGYFRMKDASLDQHEPKIERLDVVVFDMSPAGIAAKKTGQVVVAHLLDRKDPMRSLGTAVLIYIAPNKLITNSSRENFILSADDASLPFDVQIRGVFLSLLKEATH